VAESAAPPGFQAGEIRGRLESVRARIAKVGDCESVRIVAVTKGLGVEAAFAARAAGLCDLGENYADELADKAAGLVASAGDPVRWHLIGGIQRRTLRRIAPYVALYQSVDREAEALAIARYAPAAGVLVEVETTGIAGRGGVPPAGVERLVEFAAKSGLDVQGLMTIAAPGDAPAAHRSFRAVRRLVDSLGLAVASMGMSDDFEIAVEEGSTMVRLGRVLFGARPTRGAVSQ
jgi:PLP dependent protein